MTTTLGMVQATEQHLSGRNVASRNRLNGGVAANATTLTLEFDVAEVSRGDTVSVDLEDFLVWDTDTTAKTLTVEGGQNGSTPAIHADDAHVLIRPRFSRGAIVRALNDELASLSSSGLFRIRTVDLTWDSRYQGYDLAADVIDVVGVRAKTTGPTRYWPILDSWDVGRDMPTADFASGVALFLYESGYSGQTVRVTYRARYAALGATTTSDVETTTGLHAEAHDIPPLGAAARLVAAREVDRNDTSTQGDTRRPDEVQAGAVLNSARGLLALRQQRIGEEIGRLHQKYPTRLRRTA